MLSASIIILLVSTTMLMAMGIYVLVSIIVDWFIYKEVDNVFFVFMLSILLAMIGMSIFITAKNINKIGGIKMNNERWYISTDNEKEVYYDFREYYKRCSCGFEEQTEITYVRNIRNKYGELIGTNYVKAKVTKDGLRNLSWSVKNEDVNKIIQEKIEVL